jgi:hypothetical protein
MEEGVEHSPILCIDGDLTYMTPRRISRPEKTEEDIFDKDIQGLSNKITQLELEQLEMRRAFEKLRLKLESITKQRELIQLDYQNKIWSLENKQKYPNEESRRVALKDSCQKDEDYSKIEDDTKQILSEIDKLEYNTDKNAVFISSFKRAYEIKLITINNN